MSNLNIPLVVGGSMAGATVVAAAIFLGYLKYRNKRPKPELTKQRPKWQNAVAFFFQYLFLELLGVVFVVFGVLSLENLISQMPVLNTLRIAFYVFSGLKFLYLVLENWRPQWRMSLCIKSGGVLRGDWPEVFEAVIFLPAIILDGILLNIELFVGDVGDIFPYDGIIMMALDTLLLVKLFVRVSLRTHTDGTGIHKFYHVVGIAWALSGMAYEILLAFLFVLVQNFYVVIPNGGQRVTNMNMTTDLWILAVSLCLHPFVSGYTSLMRQQIKANDRALRDAPVARVKQLNLYLRYFQKLPWIYVINIVLYGACYFFYVYLYFLTANVLNDILGSTFVTDAFRAGIIMVLILLHAVNALFALNLVYGSLKRIGPLIGARPPFDCTTYAMAINKALAEANAGFRMDTHMQVAR